MTCLSQTDMLEMSNLCVKHHMNVLSLPQAFYIDSQLPFPDKQNVLMT